MNTVQLECFVTVAEHLNFSKASRVLKITQPAVSHQIQTLEEELGVKLFNRTSKSVTLTQEGISFFADAQLILKTAVSAKERLGKHEQFIPFELGCHNYTEMNLFPPCLKRTVPGISSAPSFHTNDSIPFYSGNGRKYPADGSSGHKIWTECFFSVVQRAFLRPYGLCLLAKTSAGQI